MLTKFSRQEVALTIGASLLLITIFLDAKGLL